MRQTFWDEYAIFNPLIELEIFFPSPSLPLSLFLSIRLVDQESKGARHFSFCFMRRRDTLAWEAAGAWRLARVNP